MKKYRLLKHAERIITITVLVSVCWMNITTSLLADNIYQISYEYAYNAAYEGGQQEREEGYNYEPEVVLAQPIFQMLIKSIKAQLNLPSGQEEEFDKGFRDGWFTGFKDGYYGYSKKRTRFDN